MKHIPYLGDGAATGGGGVGTVVWSLAHPGTGFRPCDGRTLNAVVFTEMVESGWNNANGVILPTISNAVNANGLTAYMMVGGPNETPIWTTSAIANTVSNASVDRQLEAYDPDGTSITFTMVSGTLPTGLTLYSNGRILGSTLVTGGASATFRATDGDGLHSDRNLSLFVLNPVLEQSMAGARPVQYSIPVPPGFTSVDIEVIGYGEQAYDDDVPTVYTYGGYARKNAQSLAGVSALYLSTPNTDSGVYVHLNDSSGTVVCRARRADSTSASVGDVNLNYNGHAGFNTGFLNAPGTGTTYGSSAAFSSGQFYGGILLKWNA